MDNREFKEFSESFGAAWDFHKPLSDRAILKAFDVLKHYPLSMILCAIDAHCQDRNKGQYAPKPSDIIDQIEKRNPANQRLSADEAWAMMPRSEDETVVWTEEMSGAYAAAYDLIIEGDRIAARMAFKGAYDRLCSEASMMQKPVVWKVCTGYDKTLIEPTLQKAVLAGRITQNLADKHLPAPQDAGVIAGLLTGKVTDLPNNAQHLKSKWKELGQAMRDGQQKLEDQKRQEALDRENKRIERERINRSILEEAERLVTETA